MCEKYDCVFNTDGNCNCDNDYCTYWEKENDVDNVVDKKGEEFETHNLVDNIYVLSESNKPIKLVFEGCRCPVFQDYHCKYAQIVQKDETAFCIKCTCEDKKKNCPMSIINFWAFELE